MPSVFLSFDDYVARLVVDGGVYERLFYRVADTIISCSLLCHADENELVLTAIYPRVISHELSSGDHFFCRAVEPAASSFHVSSRLKKNTSR